MNTLSIVLRKLDVSPAPGVELTFVLAGGLYASATDEATYLGVVDVVTDSEGRAEVELYHGLEYAVYQGIRKLGTFTMPEDNVALHDLLEVSVSSEMRIDI